MKLDDQFFGLTARPARSDGECYNRFAPWVSNRFNGWTRLLKQLVDQK